MKTHTVIHTKHNQRNHNKNTHSHWPNTTAIVVVLQSTPDECECLVQSCVALRCVALCCAVAAAAAAAGGGAAAAAAAAAALVVVVAADVVY